MFTFFITANVYNCHIYVALSAFVLLLVKLNKEAVYSLIDSGGL